MSLLTTEFYNPLVDNILSFIYTALILSSLLFAVWVNFIH